jgi:hypothetical protein
MGGLVWQFSGKDGRFVVSDVNDRLRGGIRHELAAACGSFLERFGVNDLTAAQTVKQNSIVSLHDSSFRNH